MGQRSRYVRMLEAAALIGEAAKILDMAHTADPISWGVALSRSRGLAQAAYNELESVAQEASNARGMYASNAAVRKAIVSGGETIRVHLPHLNKVISDIALLGPDNVLDRQAAIQSLVVLAAQFGSITFNPVRRGDLAPVGDDTLTQE